MNVEQTWTGVDEFAGEHMGFCDPLLSKVLERCRTQGLPSYGVSPAQGRLLQLLVQMTGARRVLEIGTLGGYSSICMARALPADGHLITLEFDPHHAEVARANILEAGLVDKIQIRVGPALESLNLLASESTAPFDFAFIDADKANNAPYIDWCAKLCRSGAVIICDNVVRGGAVLESSGADQSVVGARAAIETMGRVAPSAATIVQTVGAKGYDGFAMMIKP